MYKRQVYLLCFHLWGNVFAANVVATAVVYFWSVAMARVLKACLLYTSLRPGPDLPGTGGVGAGDGRD